MAMVTFLLGLTIGLASASLIRKLATYKAHSDELRWEMEEFCF